jgi:DNA mismatch repair protein MutH
MPLTIQEIQGKIEPLIGKPIYSPLTTNKGATGLLLETITGIPHTPNCLDCSDGELKTFPIKKLKSGKYVPKETMAITMLDVESLKTCCFQDSRCGKKINRMLIVPYFREGDTIKYLRPMLWETAAHEQLCKKIEEDYNLIQSTYLKENILKSELGTYLQTRTKGAGHGTTSRAFYLRTKFLKETIPLPTE